MSLKLFFKNLNVCNLEKNFNKEIDLNSNQNINDILNSFCQNFQLDSSTIDLSYRGEILNKSKTLNEYLDNSNYACLYLIENKALTCSKSNPATNEIASLVNHINNIFRIKIRRYILEKLLQDKSKLYELLKTIPELKNDPFSFNYIQSYDLIKLLVDAKKSEEIMTSHPNIYYSLKIIVDFVRDMSKKSQIDETFVPKGSYSIDEMSEDEEQTQPSFAMGPGTSRQTQQPAISQDYLSAVLSMLNQQRPQPQTSQQPIQPPVQAPQPTPQQAQGLDRNYFQNIMQQLISQNTSPQPTNTGPSQQIPQSQAPQQSLSDNDLAVKLEQMHELGFLNDELNLRALQITEGNVEAAISLIIEGGDMI